MPLTMPLPSVLLLSLLGPAAASMYDVIQPTYLPAKGCECSDWTDLGAVQKVSAFVLSLTHTQLRLAAACRGCCWWWWW